jgi:TonB-linked SusC/RagA family outer membrane protein
MKKKRIRVPVHNQALSKLWKIMRLSVFFLMLFISQAFATLTYSQQMKLTLKMQETKVIDVLSKIEEESQFYFLFNQKLVDVERRVNVDVKNESINKVLTDIFQNTNVTFQVKDRQIILTTANPAQIQVNQQKSVSGKVTDTSGLPLPGVSVVIKGTTSGTITDPDGNYSLTNIPENAVLQFSFVGMKGQEIAVAGKTSINVRMAEETVGVDEVVVVGYGSQTKASLTTAVSAIKGEELAKKTTADVRKALQGAVPGLAIIDQGGAPGEENISIRIRGITSVNSVNPLVLVDGVEQSLNNVDPNVIESISVLKDAASTAIYGSRGANGVIVITTKKADEGKISLMYNGFMGTSYPTTWPDPIDTRGYMEMQNLTYKNSRMSTVPYPDIDGYIANMEKYPDLFPKAFPEWDEIMDWAPLVKHSLVATGGTKNVRSMFNLAYEDQTSVIPGHGAKQYQLRTNNEIKITDNIKSFVNISLNRNDSYKPNNIDQWYYQLLFSVSEFQNKRFPDGSYGFSTKGENIWYMTDTNYMGKVLTVNDNAIINIGTEITFLKDFKYQFSYMINADKEAVSENSPKFAIQNYWNESSTVAKRDLNDYKEAREERFRTTLNSLLTYQKTFSEKHDVNILAGYSEDEFKMTGVSAEGVNFYNNQIRNLAQGDPLQRSIGNSYTDWGLRSYFSRMAYAFNQKYFVEVNGRYDGSSRFPKGNKYTFFPSASAAWRLSEEGFWAPLKSKVNEFKLRYSYGVTGNQNIGNYTHIPQLRISNGYGFYNSASGAEELVNTIGQTDLASTELSWETTYQHNLGLDVAFLKNKLSLSLDVFDKTTDGILLDVPVAAVIGLNPSKTNAGIISNKGWEALVTWKDQIKDFKYSISLNNSYVVDKLEDFGGLPKQLLYNSRYYRAVGTSLYQLYGFVFDGYYKDQADIDASPARGAKSGLFPGDIKYKDLSGPNGVPDGTITADYDNTDLGYGTPRYFFGTNINLEWKGIDLSMLWQGAGGHKVPLFGKYIESGSYGGWMAEYSASDYWTGPDDVNARFPIPRRNAGNNIQASDKWLANGTYFRLKSLTLGYTLPASWVKFMNLGSVRIYGNATNPITFSELYSKWNFEPEGSIGNLRYDYYPQIKSYNAGIMVSF